MEIDGGWLARQRVFIKYKNTAIKIEGVNKNEIIHRHSKRS